MPLQSISLTRAKRTGISRRLRALQKEGHLPPTTSHDLELAFGMHIQLVPKKQIMSMQFGKPEGVRILVRAGRYIIAAADFRYHGSSLRFMQLCQGTALKEILSALNKLEKKFNGEPEPCYLQMVSFFPAPGFYFMSRIGRQRNFFEYAGARLKPLTADQLQHKIRTIIAIKKQNVSIH